MEDSAPLVLAVDYLVLLKESWEDLLAAAMSSFVQMNQKNVTVMSARLVSRRRLWEIGTVGFLIGVAGLLFVWVDANRVGRLCLYLGWTMVFGSLILDRVLEFREERDK